MTYPPERHMLRDLAISARRCEDGSTLASAPIHPPVCNELGFLRSGVIATVIDVAGASLALTELHPDRTATLELSYQSERPGRVGPLLASARLLRRGSLQVVVGVEVSDGRGCEDLAQAESIGTGLIVFRRLPTRDDHARIPGPAERGSRASLGLSGSRLDEPFLSRAQLRVLDAAAGVVEIDNHDYVRNSFGTLNGGMVATLIEVAAEHAARARCGSDLVSADLAVHYVGQSGPGPLRTRTRVVRAGREHAVCRVELVDAGAGDRLLSIGTVTAARI